MANLLKVNGAIVKHIQPQNRTQFSLQELYVLLDCTFIELLRLEHHPGIVLAIDERGQGVKERNLGATIFARYQGIIDAYDFIAGDALVLAENEIRYTDTQQD